MNRKAVGAVAVAALALVLRVWSVGEPAQPTGDEPFQIPSARSYLATGHLNPTSWPYPPLQFELLRASMAVFGDDSLGWRMRNVLLGSAAAVLVALLGWMLYPSRERIGWIAGLVLAVDPLHVVISRSTFEEIPAATFFLLAAALAIAHLRSERCVPLGAALALGGSFATKQYYVLAGPLLAATVVAVRVRQARRGAALAAAACFLVVPLAVLVAASLPWFGRGYGLGEFVDFQLDAAREILSRDASFWAHAEALDACGRQETWFLSWCSFGFPVEMSGGWARFIVFARNPPVWLAVLPAVAFAAYRGVRERGVTDLAVAASFAAAYAPMLLASRAIYFYSSLAVFPFACVAIGRLADAAADRFPASARGWAAAAALCAAFLYPLATALPVPMPVYAPILRWMTIL